LPLFACESPSVIPRFFCLGPTVEGHFRSDRPSLRGDTSSPQTRGEVARHGQSGVSPLAAAHELRTLQPVRFTPSPGDPMTLHTLLNHAAKALAATLLTHVAAHAAYFKWEMVE